MDNCSTCCTVVVHGGSAPERVQGESTAQRLVIVRSIEGTNPDQSPDPEGYVRGTEFFRGWSPERVEMTSRASLFLFDDKYESETQLKTNFGCDEKTTRKWCEYFVKKVALLRKIKVRVIWSVPS